MIDIIQILITVVITVLTILLTIIGVEIFRILQEAKKTVKRVNNVLTDVERITSSVAAPIETATHVFSGLQQGIGVANFIVKLVETKFSKFQKENEK